MEKIKRNVNNTNKRKTPLSLSFCVWVCVCA